MTDKLERYIYSVDQWVSADDHPLADWALDELKDSRPGESISVRFRLKPEIKPCPMCNSEAQYQDSSIICIGCGLRTGQNLHMRDAILLWNKRDGR